MTKNEIVYTIINVLTRFGFTDDSRFDPDQISFMVDNVRGQLIKIEFDRTKVVDPTWKQDLGFVQVTPVNFADDPSILGCDCMIGKLSIPDSIDLRSPNTNTDSALTIMSACGTNLFYPTNLELFRMVPKEHVKNKFNYYAPVGNALYLNRLPKKVRVIGVFAKPSDVNDINSEYVLSGDLVVGTSYKVYAAQITHNSLGYNVGQTFTAANTTYTGNGFVKLVSQSSGYSDETSSYPVQPDMARQIWLEILTKEFGIEETKIADIKNSSADDEKERKKPITP